MNKPSFERFDDDRAGPFTIPEADDGNLVSGTLDPESFADDREGQIRDVHGWSHSRA